MLRDSEKMSDSRQPSCDSTVESAETFQHFEVKENQKKDPLKKKNRRLIYLTVILAIAVIALTIAVIVVAVSSNDLPSEPTTTSSSSSTSTTSSMTTSTTTGSSTTGTPIFTEEEISRIDCYPEALENPSQFSVDAAKCSARGCKFDEATTAGAPKCFVSPDTGIGLGYSLGTTLKDDDNGMMVRLSPRQTATGLHHKQAIGDVIFEVNYYGEDKLGFKVSTTC